MHSSATWTTTQSARDGVVIAATIAPATVNFPILLITVIAILLPPVKPIGRAGRACCPDQLITAHPCPRNGLSNVRTPPHIRMILPVARECSGEGKAREAQRVLRALV
jgi:hypothetical protein